MILFTVFILNTFYFKKKRTFVIALYWVMFNTQENHRLLFPVSIITYMEESFENSIDKVKGKGKVVPVLFF